MKLKTKFQDEDFELGEVVDAIISTTSLVDTHIKLKAKAKRGGEHMFNFSRISELFELFEDYEEPKEYYYLNEYLELDHEMWTDTEFDKKLKAIGNYFETGEEAEKAVEKLKAWKRLKDKGFMFNGWVRVSKDLKAKLEITAKVNDFEIYDDLDLLFGGEE